MEGGHNTRKLKLGDVVEVKLTGNVWSVLRNEAEEPVLCAVRFFGLEVLEGEVFTKYRHCVDMRHSLGDVGRQNVNEQI